MRVLLQGRIDLLDHVGGDTTTITGIKNATCQQGVDVDINTDNIDKFDRYDLIHLFGIMRIHDLYPHFLQAKKYHKKIIVTPIYEDLSYLDKYGRIGWERFVAKTLPNDLKELAKGLLRGAEDLAQLKSVFLQLIVPYSKQQKNLLTSVDHIIATSDGEKNDLIKNFALSKSKFSVIPICIKKETHQVSKDLFVNKYGLTNFILSVGRIEPKKNQLNLLKALKDTEMPVLFVGRASYYHKSYVNNFLKQLRNIPNAKYLGYLDKKMLLSAYAAAKVHVLPSWFEVLGITSLEAAMNGCNIVTTDKGYAKEYFKDFAWYCNPQYPESIRRSVFQAYSQPTKKDLKTLIVEKYTWDKIIPKILEVYKRVLEK